MEYVTEYVTHYDIVYQALKLQKGMFERFFWNFRESLIHLFPMYMLKFLYPLTVSEKGKVFWCLQQGRERVHWERMD